MTASGLGRKGSISAHCLWYLMRQELKERSWRNTNYWLALHALLSLLSQTTQNHLFRGGAHNGLSAPTSVINQENALQIYLEAI